MLPADFTLLDRWRRTRDAEAFREIALRHSGMVYALCCRILGNPADAQEVAQECFLKLAQERSSIRVSVAGWLHTVATRCALDRRRQDRRRHTYEQRYAEGLPKYEQLAWNDLEPLVDEAIAELPDRLKAPILCHFIENQTHAEAGERLGISRSAVTKRIQHGIDHIRKSLKKKGIFIQAGALAVMFRQNAPAAPAPSLSAAIGKMALSGIMRPPASPWAGFAEYASSLVSAKGVVASGLGMLILLGAAGAYFLRPASAPSVAPDPGRITQSAPRFSTPSPHNELETLAATDLASRPVPEIAEATVLAGDDSAAKRLPLGTIEGRVVDAFAQPLHGAAIEVWGHGATGATTSNTDGGFSVLVFPADRPGAAASEGSENLLLVTAARKGYVKAFQPRIPLGISDLEIVLTPPGEIRGVAVESVTGSPISSFQARIARERTPLEGVQDLHRPWQNFAATNGAFVLETCYETREIKLRAPGFGIKSISLLAPQGAILAGILAELDPGKDISGIVLDAATRLPVEGAWVGVSLDQTVEWRGFDLDNLEAVTGPDGCFLLIGTRCRSPRRSESLA